MDEQGGRTFALAVQVDAVVCTVLVETTLVLAANVGRLDASTEVLVRVCKREVGFGPANRKFQALGLLGLCMEVQLKSVALIDRLSLLLQAKEAVAPNLLPPSDTTRIP